MVELKQGFHAKEGSNFTAYIDGCGGRSMRLSNSNIIDEDIVLGNQLKSEIKLEIEPKIKSKIKIYPNPSANGKLTIDLMNRTKSKIQVYTLNGRLVKDAFGKGKMAIDLSHAKKGIYLVKIISKDETIYKRIIIK